MSLATGWLVSHRHRSLWPREHGAYVQLLAPLGAALIIVPSVAGGLIAVAAAMAFVANESLLVACGARGSRMRVEVGERAQERLIGLATVAAVVGVIGLALSPAALVPAGLVAVPALIAGVLATRRNIHNAAGELAAAAALCGVSAVVLVAGGTTLSTALVLWWAWLAGYAATIIAVQHVIASHRTAPKRGLPLAMCVVSTAALVVATLVIDSRISVGAPLALASCGIVLRTPAATRLRAVGILLAVIAAGSALGLGVGA